MSSKPLQIFRAGTHVSVAGASLSFSEADLAATAAAYDPTKFEAPIVVGHPTLDAPAYGWVRGLAFADGALDAEPHQVDPAFAELVSAGRYKHISASFYAPDSPSNPVPGVYYLRHVGFLGAHPPAVKGLRSPSFGASEEGVVAFGDWSDQVNAGLWRRLREWFIGQFGLDQADKVLSTYDIDALQREAMTEKPDDASAPATFADPTHTQEPAMSDQDRARLAALEAENAALRASAAETAAANARGAANARHAEHASFGEGLVRAGKLAPLHVPAIVAVLDRLAATPDVVEFGEGAAKQSVDPASALRAVLDALPKTVEFGEVAGGRPVIDTDDAHALAAGAQRLQAEALARGEALNSAQAVAQLRGASA